MAVDLLNVTGLRTLDWQRPVVMVNLMRFRDHSFDGEGSGWDAYLRYSALTVPMIKARGGTLLWTGEARPLWSPVAARRSHREPQVGDRSNIRSVRRDPGLPLFS